MKKVFFVFFIAGSVLAVAGLFLPKPQVVLQQNNFPEKFHYSLQTKKEDFTSLPVFHNTKPESGKIYAAIVSHHLLAEKYIAAQLGQLKGQTPEVVVLLSPNHFNTGKAPILASGADYITPFGTLENHNSLFEKVISARLAANEEIPFEKEHGVSALAGYIKLTFPQAKFLPLMLKRGSPLTNAEVLGSWLAENLPENSLVLVSADFSHHFGLKKTLDNDKKTLEIFKNYDLGGVNNMEVDTRQSIAALFKFLELKKARAGVYCNTNAAYILGNRNLTDVTSYFFVNFQKGEPKFLPCVNRLDML